jgi:hypothetical protein
MIFEIAAGVCRRIVAAAVVLRYWRQLLEGSVAVIVWVAIGTAIVRVVTRARSHIGGFLTTAGD